MRSMRSLVLMMTAALAGLTAGCPSDDTSGNGAQLNAGAGGQAGVASGGSGGSGGDGGQGHLDSGVSGEGGAGGMGAGIGGESGIGVTPSPDAGEPMFTGQTSGEKIDLLFMVDNSNTMREEQAALRAQFPRLVQALLAGVDLDGDGTLEYQGARDVHLGVVSSDLGLPGIDNIEGCAGLGDNGVLASTASPEVQGCSQQTFDPPFLTYVEGTSDPEQVASDFACLATLGTDGCGFEQQLESALKAVWAGGDDRIMFVADPLTSSGNLGNAGPGFPNGGFIRNDPSDLSLIAIVIVTDEEDCSSKRTDHFSIALPASDPRSSQGLNLRCYFESLNPDGNIFQVERYVRGFKELRPGNDQLVLFGAIVGVPPELVTPEKIAAVDYGDTASVDAFYDGILAHEKMQYAIDDKGTTVFEDDNLQVSCMSGADDDPTARAYPPRRIVQVAKGFGRNGFIQSICDDDFVPAIDLIITRIAETFEPIIE